MVATLSWRSPNMQQWASIKHDGHLFTTCTYMSPKLTEHIRNHQQARGESSIKSHALIMSCQEFNEEWMMKHKMMKHVYTQTMQLKCRQHCFRRAAVNKKSPCLWTFLRHTEDPHSAYYSAKVKWLTCYSHFYWCWAGANTVGGITYVCAGYVIAHRTTEDEHVLMRLCWIWHGAIQTLGGGGVLQKKIYQRFLEGNNISD